jgi:putative phosphoribosyl transferase
MRMRDRTEAGQRLVPLVNRAHLSDPVVLGLGGGGLAVAAEIARALRAPLDILIVEELDLGDAFHPPLYVGAVGDTGRVIIHPEATARLHLTAQALDTAVTRARIDTNRRVAFLRGPRDAVGFTCRTVVVVDDGTSGPGLIHAALDITQAAEPATTVLALPYAPQETLDELAPWTDDVICAQIPPWLPSFILHSHLYEDDRIPDDDGIRQLLARSGESVGTW